MKIGSITLTRDAEGFTARLDGAGKRRRSKAVRADTLGKLFGAKGELVKELVALDEARRAEVAEAGADQ